jgi:hypothetical protein
MKLFKRLFVALNKKSVKYLVGGGVAVNLYGIERSTADVDIILKLDRKNILKFIGVIKEIGLKPKTPVRLEDFIDPEKRKGWIEKKGMKVFSFYDPQHPFFILDVFTNEPFDFDEVYKKRKKIQFENTYIPLVPVDELINMKKKSNRPQDRADIFYLRKIMKQWEQ